jgi:hypothetical protein
MDFELSYAQPEFKGRVTRLSDREVAPHAAAFEREALSLLCTGVRGDQPCRRWRWSRARVHPNAGALPILVYGNEEQKACFVPYVVRGLKIGCFALAEQTTESHAWCFRQ